MFNNGGYSLADIAAATGERNTSDMFGGNGAWWIIILFLFCFMGWGGNGFANGNGVTDGYVLTSDFANIERKLDGVNNGICDGFYAMNTGMLNGFSNIQQTVAQNGYETRLSNQQLGTQMGNCCCDIKEGIQANTTQGILNTNTIQQQISNCCCENEKATMQNRFDMAQYNCSTLQAIDKMGDRIIDYLVADKNQTLRDENQALRLAASQQAQNNYLVQTLRPSAVPAYQVANPYASYSNGCNCCATY